MKKYIYLFILVLLSLTITSCQNVFGSKTDPSSVYGEWLYTRENGSGITLEIKDDGTYSYNEFSSKGNVFFSNEGKYSLSDTRLILKGLDGEDGRYSIFAISMKTDESGSDVLSLVPKMTARFDFVRISAPVEHIADKLPLEGTWVNNEFGSAFISGDSMKFVAPDGSVEIATIDASKEGVLKLSFKDGSLEAYENVSYFIVNDSLYVVFMDVSSEAIIFSRGL